MLEKQKKLCPVFKINGTSNTIILPAQLARQYDIVAPSYVTIQGTDNGILIKKARIED